MSQGIALEGMRLVKETLVRVDEDENDIEERSIMMAAALMGAVAISKGLGAVHALSHAIGAYHHTHHGTTNAVLLPAILKHNRPVIEDTFESAARYLNILVGFDRFCNFILEQNERLGVPSALVGLGVVNPDVERLAQTEMNDFKLQTNPRKMKLEDLKTVFQVYL